MATSAVSKPLHVVTVPARAAGRSEESVVPAAREGAAVRGALARLDRRESGTSIVGSADMVFVVQKTSEE